jgi:hypothetical protein
VYSLAFGNTIAANGTIAPAGSATDATVTIKGSILYGNTDTGDVEDDLVLDAVKGKHANASSGSLASPSIIGASTPAGAVGSPITSNPDLASLANNGGSLETMKPAPGSPALGAGSSCDATDELGAPRPMYGCDLGALELTPAMAPIVATSAAGAIAETGAKLNGTVNPKGDATSYRFELSTSSAFASFKSLPSTPDAAGSGTTPVPVAADAIGLSPGTAYYYRLVATNNIGSSTSAPAQQFKTQPAQSTTATFGDQQLTLTTPSLRTCTANKNRLVLAFKSTTIRKSKRAKLKFSSAAFFIDKGVKHVHRKTEHTRSGKKKTVIVTTYTANATKHRVPVTLALSLRGLKPGTHTLKVVNSYKETTRKHGHPKTVTVTKTLTEKFKVC